MALGKCILPSNLDSMKKVYISKGQRSSGHAVDVIKCAIFDIMVYEGIHSPIGLLKLMHLSVNRWLWWVGVLPVLPTVFMQMSVAQGLSWNANLIFKWPKGSIRVTHTLQLPLLNVKLWYMSKQADQPSPPSPPIHMLTHETWRNCLVMHLAILVSECFSMIMGT